MGPITLENADFNLAAANIDTTKHRDLLNSKILQLGLKQICAAMFKQLCPIYSDQPHVVIEHIHDLAPGPNGQWSTYRCGSSRVFPTPPEHFQAFCPLQDIAN